MLAFVVSETILNEPSNHQRTEKTGPREDSRGNKDQQLQIKKEFTQIFPHKMLVNATRGNVHLE